MRLNNINFKYKFVLLFVICVCIPLISTNSFLISAMVSAGNEDGHRQLENLADRAEYDISTQVRNIVSVADYFYTDKRISDFLEHMYSSNQEYYESYRQLMDSNIIQNFKSAESVSNIVICTDNPTVTNGTYFVKTSDVQASKWYQMFLSSKRSRLICAFYEDGADSKGYLEKGRHIALIQRMDYFGGNGVMLLDVDYQKLFEEMRMEDQELILYDPEKILFSTSEARGDKLPFTELGEDTEKRISTEKSLKFYGTDWTLRLSRKPYEIWSILKDHPVWMALIYIFNLMLPAILIWTIYRSFKVRLNILIDNMIQVRRGVYHEIETEEEKKKGASGGNGKDELGEVIKTYDLMIRKIHELIEIDFKNREKQQNLEISRRQAELAALQSQINPHFMFNALESIRMHSVLKNETETAHILEDFSVLMRKNIQWNKDFVTVLEEMDNVKRYLQIQKYRFGDRLEYSVHIQDGFEKLEIPKFIVTTFVENACVHGIEDSLDGGTITVIASCDEQYMYFEVMDSGSGMEEEELLSLQKKIEHATITDIQQAGKSIGILNSVVRMRQYYGEDVVIDVNSTKGEGTEVCIRLPLAVQEE